MSICPSADLVCPITLELPFDPVTAEDGRVYEREAIEQHIKTQGRNLKSPMTNRRMGNRLFPAPQTKNVIEALIHNGVLQGDLISKWNEKVKEKKFMEKVIQDANNGNAEAMCRVGDNYLFGIDGFKVDTRLAFDYYSKAHDKGHVTATAMLGQCFLFGDGVQKCNPHGLMHIGIAAANGSRLAAWMLGMALTQGRNTKVDEKEAIRWFRVVVEGGYVVDDLSRGQLDEAKKLLAELTN